MKSGAASVPGLDRHAALAELIAEFDRALGVAREREGGKSARRNGEGESLLAPLLFLVSKCGAGTAFHLRRAIDDGRPELSGFRRVFRHRRQEHIRSWLLVVQPAMSEVRKAGEHLSRLSARSRDVERAKKALTATFGSAGSHHPDVQSARAESEILDGLVSLEKEGVPTLAPLVRAALSHGDLGQQASNLSNNVLAWTGQVHARVNRLLELADTLQRVYSARRAARACVAASEFQEAFDRIPRLVNLDRAAESFTDAGMLPLAEQTWTELKRRSEVEIVAHEGARRSLMEAVSKARAVKDLDQEDDAEVARRWREFRVALGAASRRRWPTPDEVGSLTESLAGFERFREERKLERRAWDAATRDWRYLRAVMPPQESLESGNGGEVEVLPSLDGCNEPDWFLAARQFSAIRRAFDSETPVAIPCAASAGAEVLGDRTQVNDGGNPPAEGVHDRSPDEPRLIAVAESFGEDPTLPPGGGSDGGSGSGPVVEVTEASGIKEAVRKLVKKATAKRKKKPKPKSK